MPAQQSTNWTFTSFADQPPAFDDDFHKYLLYGREVCPDTGRRHYQGYCQVIRKCTLARMKQAMGQHIHFEIARGGYDANKRYCSKDGDWDEFGTPTVSSAPGSRTDLTVVLQQIADGRSVNDLMSEYPDAIARHLRFFQLAETNYKRTTGVERLRTSILALTLRPWQDRVAQLALSTPDPRRVHWFWDPVGNTGKSTIVDYLVAVSGATVFTHGKLADIAHAYDFQRIVCFDLARTTAEHADSIYAAIEMFKNGRIFSPKYESTTKVFEKPHVFVFANWEPDTTKLSEDRWDIQRTDM